HLDTLLVVFRRSLTPGDRASVAEGELRPQELLGQLQADVDPVLLDGGRHALPGLPEVPVERLPRPVEHVQPGREVVAQLLAPCLEVLAGPAVATLREAALLVVPLEQGVPLLLVPGLLLLDEVAHLLEVRLGRAADRRRSVLGGRGGGLGLALALHLAALVLEELVQRVDRQGLSLEVGQLPVDASCHVPVDGVLGGLPDPLVHRDHRFALLSFRRISALRFFRVRTSAGDEGRTSVCPRSFRQIWCLVVRTRRYPAAWSMRRPSSRALMPALPAE